MFLGLSNGTLMAWTDAFEPATSSDPQSSSNGPTVMKAQGHSGAISSLVFLRTLAPDRALRDDCKKQRNEHPPSVPASSSLQAALARSKTVEREGGFLFTGSADRTIKLWVVEQRKLVCVRTHCFHGGTVVSLAYCFPYLFSASTDGTALVCRVEQTSGSLKYPQFTVVERVFAHSIYHPSTKLVLSNKQAWYDSLAVRCNGDRICLYCGATDGSLLVLENTQTYVPAKPVVGSGGAPPVNLHTQARATVWSEARERASTAVGRGRLYSSLLCNTSCWGSISGPEVGEDVGYRYQGEQIPAGAASYARGNIQSGALPVPFRLQNKLNVHTLGLRKVYALPLESAVATLGSDASISVVDPVAGQTSWKEENPEGCCYSACAWMSSLNLLLVGDSCGCLSFYNIYSKERVHSQQVTEHRIVSLSIATHERNVVVSTAHEVLLVEVIEAAEEVALTGHQGAVTHILWQPTAEGGYMYTSADDAAIRQWDVQKGLCTRVIRHKYADVTSWMLIDALNGFVTGHEDGDVRFWYLKDFSSFSIHNQKGHHIHINSVTGMCCWRPTSTAKPEDHKRSKVVTNAEDDNASSNAVEHSGISSNGERDLAVTPPIYQVLTCGYDGRLNVTEIRADAETGEITTKVIVRRDTHSQGSVYRV
ncbi:UNVERIFIED_CONTAM: WD domain, G-beta repeat protein [Hammondia hammondi]|eukprot:XP_008884964.1 WD domain, G-beta repeat protein [Hammondia hammondi]